MGFLDVFKKKPNDTESKKTTTNLKAQEVQKKANQFLSDPSSHTIKSFMEIVKDSHDPAVTDILLDLMTHNNAGLRGLAIQSLGLVYDPRALIAVIHAYQNAEITDHKHRAALSVINLVANYRDTNPIAVYYLMAIVLDNITPKYIKLHSITALSRFEDNDQAKEFLLKLRTDSDEEISATATSAYMDLIGSPL